MNYQAFTNDSLTMMYEGIRGALASDDALASAGQKPGFAFGKPRIGKCTLATSRARCSGAECFSTSSTGQKIRARCRSKDEQLAARAQVRVCRIERVPVFKTGQTTVPISV
jgi:hypothetical protein